MSSDVKKTFSDLFSKIDANDDERSFMASVESYKIRRADDGDTKLYEFFTELDRLYPKKTIYSLENKIKSAYGVSSVRIFPHYPAELSRLIT